MALNQTEIFDALEELVAAARPDSFALGFLDAFHLPKSTLTLLRKGDPRTNVAADEGDVALKKRVYIRVVEPGVNVHQGAETLAGGDIVARHAIRFVLLTDLQEVAAIDRTTGERLDVAFSELHRHFGFFLPLAGYEKATPPEESEADLKAAAKMGRLFDLLRERNEFTTQAEIHGLNVFLTRLLFCFFAEDTGIFPEQQFSNAIARFTAEDGTDAQGFIEELFRVMNLPENSPQRRTLPAHLAAFPYVNGGLFHDEQPVPRISARTRRMIIEAGAMQWAEINPDIFGSMFQAVINEDQRSNLGQHYTSVRNIMKALGPLFLDKLTEELQASRGNARRLQALLERLCNIKVFDPACGSGNFLIIAYKELRRLEIEVFKALDAVSEQGVMFMSGIHLEQFHGIEMDDFAHEVAMLALWVAEHQMNQVFRRELGRAEPALPLKSAGRITRGNSLRVSWDIACPKDDNDEVYVVGNPPFLGKQYRSTEQTDDMARVFAGFRTFKALDYVASWFWKGAQYIHGSRAEMALVSTSSICQGQQVSMLWPAIFDLGLRIHFAWQSFPWKNSAKHNAGVHVVIVGLSPHAVDGRLHQRLDGGWQARTVRSISPYLVEGSPLAVASRSAPPAFASKMLFGSMPNDGGNLILSPQERDRLLANEPGAAPWIRRLIGAEEFLNGADRYCLWLTSATPHEIQELPLVSARVDAVRHARQRSRRASSAKLACTPHLFGERRQPEYGNYIVVPCVSSERRPYAPIGYFDASTIASNLVQIIPEATFYEFGILHSMMHNDWMRAVGGRLKSDYRYSAKLVYNTFPWPTASNRQREEIEALAKEVLLIREDYPAWSLAELYDPERMPAPLKAAHERLDAAVERLYRKQPFRDASERLEHLFALYEAQIASEGGPNKSRGAA